jgi:hypothetical protein
MKLCPKCRNFYDDELLRFCLKDGMPLVSVKPNEELWSEATNSIRKTRRIEQKEIRKQQLKKVVTTLITTFIIISVISVIALNSWIYTHPEETAKLREEKVEVSDPKPAETPNVVEIPEISESTPTPTPILEKTPRKDLQTPTPTDTPKPIETPIPTVEPTKTKTTKTKPSPTITATPFVCNTANEADAIKRSWSSYFSQQIRSLQLSLNKQYMTREIQIVLVEVTLGEFTPNILPNCKSASINHPYDTILVYKNGNRKPIPMSKGFSCSKSAIWSCR